MLIFFFILSIFISVASQRLSSSSPSLFATAQPILDYPNRSVEFFTVCGTFDKFTARDICVQKDPNAWLATPAVSHFPAIETVIASSCGSNVCYWLDGYSPTWDGSSNPRAVFFWANHSRFGVTARPDLSQPASEQNNGGTLEYSGFAANQPLSSPKDILWAGCYAAGSKGFGNDRATDSYRVLCMRYVCSDAYDCNSHGRVRSNATFNHSYIADKRKGEPFCPCWCWRGYVGPRCGRRLTVSMALTTTRTQANTVTLARSQSRTEGISSTLFITESYTGTATFTGTATLSTTFSSSSSTTRKRVHTQTNTAFSSPTKTLFSLFPSRSISETHSQRSITAHHTFSTIATRTASILPVRTRSFSTTAQPSPTSSYRNINQQTTSRTISPSKDSGLISLVVPVSATSVAFSEAGGVETAEAAGSLSAVATAMADPITILQLDAVASVMEMSVCTDAISISALLTARE